MTPFEHDLHGRTVEALAEALGGEQLTEAWAAGALLDLDGAVAQALER